MSLISFLFSKRKQYISSINGVLTLGSVRGIKAVFGGGVTQSGGELVTMWDAVIGDIAKTKKIKQCLVLGVGSGMIPHVIRKYFPQTKLIGVDKDPVMITVGNNHFEFLKTKTKVVITDALSFVKKQTLKYDLIAVDLYIGRYNAPQTKSVQFLKDLKKILAPSGSILFNADYDHVNQKAFSRFFKECTQLFSVTIVYEYPLNKILLLRYKK